MLYEVITTLALAGGHYHSCAVRTGGQVACWGRNDQGQLGDGTATDSPTPVAPSVSLRRTPVPPDP